MNKAPPRKSMELMKAQKALRSAATHYTDVIYDRDASDLTLYKADEALLKAAREYARLAELAEGKS